MGMSIFMTEELKSKTRVQGQTVTEWIENEVEKNPDFDVNSGEIENLARQVFTPDVMLAMAAAAVDAQLIMNKSPEERVMEMLMPQQRKSGPVATTEFMAVWLMENPDVQERIMADPRWAESF